MQNRKNGTLLIETVIALALMCAMLPICLAAFGSVQHRLVNIRNHLVYETEYLYMDYYIRQNLKTLAMIQSISSKQIVGYSSDSEKIEYGYDAKKLKITPTTASSPKIINKLLMITDLNWSYQSQSHLLTLNLTTSIGEKRIQVFLPNVN